MKVPMMVIAIVASLLFNSVVFASGQYEIQITKLTENKFAVALIHSYSDYYDQTIEGVYASKIVAEQAGQIALHAFLSLDADEAPEPCSYDINWL